MKKNGRMIFQKFFHQFEKFFKIDYTQNETKSIVSIVISLLLNLWIVIIECYWYDHNVSPHYDVIDVAFALGATCHYDVIMTSQSYHVTSNSSLLAQIDLFSNVESSVFRYVRIRT